MKKTSKQTRKPAHSPGEWAKIVSAWKTTRLSEEEFAAKNNITVNTLQKWCKALKNPKPKIKTKKKADKQNPTEFIPLKVVGKTNFEINPDNPEKVELEFKAGHVIRLQGHISPSKIAEIYRAILEETQC